MISIAVDLDGVLTDFEGRCKELLDIDIHKHQKKYGMDSIWKSINRYGYKFWTDMSWTYDGIMLWEYISSLRIPVSVITAVPAYKYSRYPKKGKEIWINENLGKNVTRHIGRRKDKIKYLKPGTVLIDDYSKTVNEWKSVGEVGILHKSADITIHNIRQLCIEDKSYKQDI